MNHEALSALLDYHYWARDRMLEALARLSSEAYARHLGGSVGSIRDTAVHMYRTEWLWHARWRGISPSEQVPASPFPDVPSLEHAWLELEGRVRSSIRETDDDGLQRVLDYRRLNGEAVRSVFWHMVHHVVNDATYHRGQVTTLLRQVGAAPPESTDLISFYRRTPL